MSSIVVTQSRNASLIASFRICVPSVTGTTVGAEALHPEDVGSLPRHVDCTHVDRAIEAEARRHRRRRDPVLPGAGLGNDPRLSHPLDQQALPHHVVGLVGPWCG